MSFIEIKWINNYIKPKEEKPYKNLDFLFIGKIRRSKWVIEIRICSLKFPICHWLLCGFFNNGIDKLEFVLKIAFEKPNMDLKSNFGE